jgi:hypothetical protein
MIFPNNIYNNIDTTLLDSLFTIYSLAVKTPVGSLHFDEKRAHSGHGRTGTQSTRQALIWFLRYYCMQIMYYFKRRTLHYFYNVAPCQSPRANATLGLDTMCATPSTVVSGCLERIDLVGIAIGGIRLVECSR